MLSFILIAKAVIMKSIPIELKRTHTFYIYLKKRERNIGRKVVISSFNAIHRTLNQVIPIIIEYRNMTFIDIVKFIGSRN